MKNDKKNNKSSKTNKKDVEKSSKIEKLEQEKLEREKLEQAKLEQEKLEQEKLEQAKLEQEKLEQAKLEQEKLEQAKLEQAKIEQAERDFFEELEREEERLARKIKEENMNKSLNSKRYTNNHRSPSDTSDSDDQDDNMDDAQDDDQDDAQNNDLDDAQNNDLDDAQNDDLDDKNYSDDMFFIILNNSFSNNIFNEDLKDTEDTEDAEDSDNTKDTEDSKNNKRKFKKDDENKENEDENKNKKNKFDQENYRLGSFFDQIINDIQNKSNNINKNINNKTTNNKTTNNKNVKQLNKLKKINSENDFNHYFKESKMLLPIERDIKNLKDLIELGETYDPKEKSRYVINLKALNKCVEPLKELNSMIGMKNIKEMIIDLIFFRLQNLEENKEELWHLVIQGTPGSGKTEVAKIIGKLYYGLGITKEDKFIQARRSDLIGKYLGHTAKNTQEIFDKAKGGVLFIDEAYSLGNPENRDSFSKECIDTINQNLTENKDTVVFIAGYKEQLEESFFSYNPGLNRRFKIRMTVDKYNAPELRSIFLKKIEENKWFIFNENIDEQIPLSFFEKNLSYFKYNGGDMENLWHFCKIVHARRIFGKSNDIVKKITKEDLDNAFKFYSENEEFKSRDNTIGQYLFNTMYT